MSDKQREAFEQFMSEVFYIDVRGQSTEKMSAVIWDAACEWKAAQQEADPLYVRVVSEPYGPGEQFVEVETASGKSIRVPSEIKGRERLIGPLYTAPQPAKAVPEGWDIELIKEVLAECYNDPYEGPHYLGEDLYDRIHAMLSASQPDDNKP